MKVLVTWGSERGGTEGIGTTLAAALRRDGITVVERPAREVDHLDGFDAVIVGGALYANRWHRDARRFVRRHVAELRRVPVWFFSSGPLDDSAERGEIAPTGQVAVLMARVGARGHVTFGGRLAPDARGFPASAMAKKNAGDWRNPARIRAWADDLAAALPSARPGTAVEPAARSLPRLAGYLALAAALAAPARVALSWIHPAGLAIALHALIAAGLAGLLASRYFRPRGARDPLPTAAAFAIASAVPDLLIGGVGVGPVIAVLAVFAVVWAVGGIHSTLPWPRPPAQAGA